MDGILAELRRRGMPHNPPAGQEDLDLLEERLHVRLPPEVRALYEDHAGSPYDPDWVLRLLPPHEAIAETERVLQNDLLFEEDEYLRPLFERKGFALYWADADGNYAGVFSDGVLEGRVFVLDNDEAWPRPVWASVRSFYRAMLDAPAESEMDGLWCQSFDSDYPRPVDGPEDPLEDALASALFDIYDQVGDSPQGVRAGLQALSLCSPAHDDRVRELVDSSGRWLREQAEATLQRFNPDDVDLLIGQLSSSDGNTSMQALLDLKRLGDERGLRAAVDDEVGRLVVLSRDGTSRGANTSDLNLDPDLVEPYLRALWWTQIRLAHADFDACELRSSPGGLAPQDIEQAVSELGLPPPHIGFMISNPVSRVVGRSPLTIEVTLPLWWKRGKDEGVADVRLIEDVGGFAAEVIAIHTVPERKPPELGNR